MSTTYPGTKQTFTDPAGTSLLSGVDHAGLHTDVNDTLESMQDTVGTTAGTNVLKDFAAGDFPVRMDAGNTLQTAIIGTINNSTLGSATINNSTLGTPTVTLGSDAEGDLYYRSSAGTTTRLGVGTSGQYLTTNGTVPSWGTVASGGGNFKVGTIDIGTVTGTVSFTGVGFQPSMVMFNLLYNGVGTNTTFATFAQGYSTGSASQWSFADAVSGTNNSLANSQSYVLLSITSGGADRVNGSLVSLDADGFTIAIGTPAPGAAYTSWGYVAWG